MFLNETKYTPSMKIPDLKHLHLRETDKSPLRSLKGVWKNHNLWLSHHRPLLESEENNSQDETKWKNHITSPMYSSSPDSVQDWCPQSLIVPPLHVSGHWPKGRYHKHPHNTQSACVFRLCNVSVSRLQLLQTLGAEISSVILAVKMQSSKRTLRSNEIPLQPNGFVDTPLQLSFSLQYPHFLKRDGNILQIMIQRRKKYKNRTFLGCKTLAVGLVNMAQVLQRPVDRELELYSESKEKGSAVARVTLESLSSQPVDTDETGERGKSFIVDNPDRTVDLDDSDTEDYSTPDDGSDSEPMLEGTTPFRHRLHTNSRSKSLPPNARQRNLKQRFIALLKRFKVPEALQAFDQDQDLDQRPVDAEVDEAEIESLFKELEDMSDSGGEGDSLSVASTPKPSLRPYFASTRSLLSEALNVPGETCPERGVDRLSDESSKRADSDHMETWTDQEHSDTQYLASSPPREDKNKSRKNLFARDRSNMSLKEKKSHSGASTPRQEKFIIERSNSLASESSQPRKALLEHLCRILPLDDSSLPDNLILVNIVESHGSLLATYLTERGHKVVTSMTAADVKAILSHLVNKIHKFCNRNTKVRVPIKLVVVGSDTFVNNVLRPYVELFAHKPPDFQNNFRFFCIPLAGVNSLAKYLASIDSVYGEAFVSEAWKEGLERWGKNDVIEVVNKIQHYLSAQFTLNLPIAEAILTYKDKSDDESFQAFVPFLTDVRIGSGDVTSTSIDLDDVTSTPTSLNLPGSPPAANPLTNINVEKQRDITPPSSPNINAAYSLNAKSCSESGDKDPMDLQIDYWVISRGVREEKDREKDKEKTRSDGGKFAIKGTFRTLQVARLSPLGASQDPNSCQHLTFSYATREKKQRIIRLGKKKEREKETESRKDVIDGVCRLLASTRNQQPLKVRIDSLEWTNVKFFQISSQWQTHIKTFPVSVFTQQESAT